MAEQKDGKKIWILNNMIELQPILKLILPLDFLLSQEIPILLKIIWIRVSVTCCQKSDKLDLLIVYFGFKNFYSLVKMTQDLFYFIFASIDRINFLIK